MTKIHKFQNTIDPVYIEKQGVKYKVVDLGGHKMEIRVKDAVEVSRDSKLFKSYLSSSKEP